MADFNDRFAAVMDVKDHPANTVPTATEHYWGDSPSERPYNGPSQKSNIPAPDPHTNDPWNKAFND